MDWEPPPPNIRDLFTVRLGEKQDTGPGTWQFQPVEVLDSVGGVNFTYIRKYPFFYATFEPFWQWTGDYWHPYALISEDYVRTSVLDLARKKIVAEEEAKPWGFCPTEFFVPDWWDEHDGSVLPGHEYWDERRDSWPSGQFGFVAGCLWGDDSSWKIQYLDLSKISEGVIGRDERFGYIELPHKVRLKDAIDVSTESNNIGIAVMRRFRFDGKEVQ